jgi:hypothetical protein
MKGFFIKGFRFLKEKEKGFTTGEGTQVARGTSGSMRGHPPPRGEKSHPLLNPKEKP